MTNTHITIGGHKISSGAKFVKLWENPNPNTSFAPQTISLSAMANYDRLLLEFKGHSSYTDDNSAFSQITATSKVTFSSVCWSYPYTSGGTPYFEMYARSFSVSAGIITFRDAGVLSTRTNVTSVAIDNDRIIPVTIYGIKF